MHITGHNGENPILIKWVSDLQRAAEHAGSTYIDSNTPAPSKRQPKRTEKRVQEDNRVAERTEKKRRKEEDKNTREKAIERTGGNFNFNPEDLIDEPRERSGKGAKTVPLLDKLVTRCFVKDTDPKEYRWRCLGPGCCWSCADPRQTSRVYGHVMSDCDDTSKDLVEAAASASSKKSLGLQVEELNAKAASTSQQPSVHAIAQSEGREQRKTRHDYLVLLAICGLSLPPTIIDSLYWRNMIQNLDPKLKPASASHMATSLIPAEAARVREKSIETLVKYCDLTLSFDGATTRRNQSIYTVHATTPDTRQSHLLAGSSASGKAHTGKHLKAVLQKVVNMVGAHRFSAVTSDSAGNVRLAKELLAEEFPWLLYSRTHVIK
ncbi:hypothetical protein FRC12_017837 [Ceratobasidium sp. 428]|nr:hypothetical protein FRC12_017837 [Ceratobasidium sp. 428]